MVVAFCYALGRDTTIASWSPCVKRVTTLEEASAYLRSAFSNKTDGAARCLVVPNGLNRKGSSGMGRLSPYCGLPAGYDSRGACMCGDTYEGYHAEISGALRDLGGAHRAVTGDNCARARVARVSGTPCPKAHVDKVRLRIIATLRGPGVVLLPETMEEMETNEGDVVFMRGVGLDDYEDGIKEGGILHRSPARAWWMRDRVIVQVDDS